MRKENVRLTQNFVRVAAVAVVVATTKRGGQPCCRCKVGNEMCASQVRKISGRSKPQKEMADDVLTK